MPKHSPASAVAEADAPRVEWPVNPASIAAPVKAFLNQRETLRVEIFAWALMIEISGWLDFLRAFVLSLQLLRALTTQIEGFW